MIYADAGAYNKNPRHAFIQDICIKKKNIKKRNSLGFVCCVTAAEYGDVNIVKHVTHTARDDEGRARNDNNLSTIHAFCVDVIIIITIIGRCCYCFVFPALSMYV